MMLTVDALRAEVEAGRIDTVLIAMADMQGRLQGKRLAASHFLDEVLEHNAEGCNYLLAVDVDMNTVSGYAMSSWDRGYGDFVFKPDLATLRRVPWQEGTALVLCCKHGIPHLLARGGGAVVNTASFVAVMGAATSQISYTASKGGVLALSRELGVELARRNVRVNALCPGPVNTPLLQELFAKDPEKAARRLVHLPMGRFAEATEIAAAACFLASDDASYITASTFLVDGGLSSAYVTPLD